MSIKSRIELAGLIFIILISVQCLSAQDLKVHLRNQVIIVDSISINNDSLFARNNAQTYLIAIDSISGITQHQQSSTSTLIGLAGGALVGALIGFDLVGFIEDQFLDKGKNPNVTPDKKGERFGGAILGMIIGAGIGKLVDIETSTRYYDLSNYNISGKRKELTKVSDLFNEKLSQQKQSEVSQIRVDINRQLTPYIFTSQPIGNFAKTGSGNDGFAQTGYGFGADLKFEIYPRIFLIGDVGISFNTVNNQAFRNEFPTLLPDSINLSFSRWTSAWGLGGLTYNYSLTQNLDLYLSALIGVSYVSPPVLTLSTGSNLNFRSASAKLESKASIAYGFNFGVHLNQHFNLGFRLRFSEVTFNTANGTQFLDAPSQPIGLVMVTTGYTF